MKKMVWVLVLLVVATILLYSFISASTFVAFLCCAAVVFGGAGAIYCLVTFMKTPESEAKEEAKPAPAENQQNESEPAVKQQGKHAMNEEEFDEELLAIARKSYAARHAKKD